MEGTLGAYQIVWTSELLRFQTTDLSTQTSWKFRWLWDNVSDFREPFSSMFRGKSSNFRVSRFWPPMEIQYYVNLGFGWGCWMLGKGLCMAIIWLSCEGKLRTLQMNEPASQTKTRSASFFLKICRDKAHFHGVNSAYWAPKQVMCSKAFSIFFMATLSLVSSSCRHIPGRWTARNSTECLAYAWNVSSIIQKYISNMGWIRMDSDGLCMFIIYNFHIWVSENSVPLHPMVNDHYPY